MCSTDILSFTGERFHAYPSTCAHSVVWAGARHTTLRDTVYILLVRYCKQYAQTLPQVSLQRIDTGLYVCPLPLGYNC